MTAAPEPLVAIPAPPPHAIREVRHLALVPAVAGFEQGVFALTYSMPNGLDAMPAGGCDDTESTLAGQPIPDPHPWAARYMQAVVEVLARQRPVTQLARWTAGDVYLELTRLHRAATPERVQPGSRPESRPARQEVVSVHVFNVARDAAEVASRVVEGPRSRAIAARLEFRRARWTCTALSLG
jgi:hypothetical protein